MQLMNSYNASLMAMGQIPLEGLITTNKQAALRTYAIRCGMWRYVIWEQSWNKCKNPLGKFFGWK
jgi:hypothetical protein